MKEHVATVDPSLRQGLQQVRRGHAKYELLKEHLVGEMLAGRLKPGQALPGERYLEKTLGLARLTIRQAMASLETDGLIRRVQGKGNFVEENALRKLHRGQDTFALVMPETHGGFYPSLIRGFEAEAGAIRYQAIICSTEADISRQGDIVLRLLDKEVGGVAIVPTVEPSTPVYHAAQIRKHGVPLVFCHRRVEGIKAPLIAIPYGEIGRMAGRVLAERGHRKAALFTSFQSPSTQAYQDGFEETLTAAGGELPSEFVFRSGLVDHEDDVQDALKRIFSAPNPPTAIFSTFDSQAEMIYLLLPQLGLRIPEDVALLGFGGALRDSAVTRRLTSIVVDEIATGRQAVTLLHEMRRGERPIDDDTEIVMALELSEGQTLSAPSPSVGDAMMA